MKRSAKVRKLRADYWGRFLAILSEVDRRDPAALEGARREILALQLRVVRARQRAVKQVASLRAGGSRLPPPSGAQQQGELAAAASAELVQLDATHQVIEEWLRETDQAAPV